jgi:uncharacterized membrane protein
MTKETRDFFSQDNRLNKGYANSSLKESDKSFFRKRFEHLFPPVDVLQAFEDLHEGSVERIISMAEKEQVNRQKSEETKALVNERMSRIYVVAEVMVMSVVCFTVISLNNSGSSFVSMFFAFCAFLTKFLIYRKKFATQSGRRSYDFKKDDQKRYKK